jgi:hypothetical protein
MLCSLASLAFGNVLFWFCDTMGSVFAGMAVINLIRYFGDDKSAPSEQKAKEDGNWSGSPVDKEA